MTSRGTLSLALISLVFISSCAPKRAPLKSSEIGDALLHAESLLAAGKPDSAKALFAAVQDVDEYNHRALVGLGKVAIADRDWDEALDIASSGLKIDSADTTCRYLAAIAEREVETRPLWGRAHWNASRGHFEWILQHDSSFEDVLYQYAVLERCVGNRDHALELAHAQIAKKPELVQSQLGLYALYKYFVSMEDPEEFQEWAANQPGTLPQFFIGEALRRSGNLAGAESLFVALQCNPGEVSPQALHLARARLLCQQGEKQAAETEYWKGVQDLRDELGAALLFQDLKYIVSDRELDTYRTLESVSAKQEFFKSFWNFRNPAMALKTNLRLQEHIRRYVVAEERYEYTGPRTWFNNPDVLNELTFPKAFALNEEFNDMGVVYLRQGEPDDILRHSYSPFDDDDLATRLGSSPASSSPNDSLKKIGYRESELLGVEIRDRYRRAAKEDYQSWLYNATAESPKMICHFQNHLSAGNNWRLIAYPAMDAMLDHLALWDPIYQRMYSSSLEADRARLETEVRTESREVVGYALSTDKQSWEKKVATFRFPHAIDVFRAPDGRSLLDVSYAIPIAAVAGLLPDTDQSVPLEIGFSLIDSKSRKTAFELDTLSLAISQNRAGAIVNLIRYTVPPDSYGVSMHIRSLSGDIIGSWRQALRVPDYPSRKFKISSIQFLRPALDKGTLEIEGVKVVQSPFRTHVRTEPLDVYFQIYNLIPDGDGVTSYTTECSLMPRDEDDTDNSIVVHRKQKTGSEEMAAEFYRIDVSAVDPGRYKLIVKVKDNKRVETIVGMREIEILKP